jgi:hypothetical protein
MFKSPGRDELFEDISILEEFNPRAIGPKATVQIFMSRRYCRVALSGIGFHPCPFAKSEAQYE